MSAHRVLIVEDHRDLARMLQTGLKSLGPDYDVVDVPSGEEALLIVAGQPFDLYVIDAKLPGISGFVLMDRLKANHPEAKIILITGVPDHETRKRVANAGADAFFFKPVEFADLLDSIRRCLGLIPVTSPLTMAPEVEEAEEPPDTISDRLSSIRQQLDALVAMLVDDRGKPLVQAGDFPETADQAVLLPALMAVYSASKKVASLVGVKPPRDLYCVSGKEYDLYMVHVGQAYALMVVTEKSTEADRLAVVGPLIQGMVNDLQAILAQMGVPVEVEEEAPIPILEPEIVVDDQEGVPELEALFQQAATVHLKPEEVDAFWDTSEEHVDTGSLNADDLSYDQARKLGFTPSEE